MKIDKKIFIRTRRSIKCLSFNSNFYKDVQKFGLMAETIFEQRSKYLAHKFYSLITPSSIESDFQWLIKIGVLRREVDGQGLTSKVRITPIGRQVIENSRNLYDQKQNIIRKLITCFKYQLTPK